MANAYQLKPSATTYNNSNSNNSIAYNIQKTSQVMFELGMKRKVMTAIAIRLNGSLLLLYCCIAYNKQATSKSILITE